MHKSYLNGLPEVVFPILRSIKIGPNNGIS
jgi:hypothetical protein